MDRGIAVIKWGGVFILAKIVFHPDKTAMVAVFPRRSGPFVKVQRMREEDVITQLKPSFLRTDQLNEELATILEG